MFKNNIQSYKTEKSNVIGELPPFRISDVITACKQNKTVYEVLRIENFFSLSDIKDSKEKKRLEAQLDDYVNNLSFTSSIQILQPEDKKKLENLQKSDLVNFDNDKFKDNVNTQITSQSLTELSTKLREAAKNLKGEQQYSEIKITLRNSALHLDTYQHNLVEPMTKQARELLDLSTKLDNILRKDGKPFNENMDIIIKELEQAQTFISERGSTFVKDTLIELKNHLIGQIDNYIKFIVDSIQNDVGKCGPIANVYQSGVTAVCNKFVDPLNGFWAGTAWCVILFLPTIIICVKLSSLYQKSDPYPGPLVEK